MKTTTKQIRSNAAMTSISSGKPLTAYNFFFREQRLNMLRNGEKIPKGSGTISRVVAAKWKKLDAVARCQYEFKAQVERKMYNFEHSNSSKSLKTPSPTNATKEDAVISAPPTFKEFSPWMQSQPSLKNSASEIKKTSFTTDFQRSSDDKKLDASQFQMDTKKDAVISAPPTFLREFSPWMQSQPSFKNSASGIKKTSSQKDFQLSSDDKKFDASQFQMRVFASLQESAPDKDFVDYVLSLKLV